MIKTFFYMISHLISKFYFYFIKDFKKLKKSFSLLINYISSKFKLSKFKLRKYAFSIIFLLCFSFFLNSYDSRMLLFKPSSLLAQEFNNNILSNNNLNKPDILINQNFIFNNKFNVITLKNIQFEKSFNITVNAIDFNNNKIILFNKSYKIFNQEYRIIFFVSEKISKIEIIVNIDDYKKYKQVFIVQNPILYQKYYLYNINLNNLNLDNIYKLIKSNKLNNLEPFDILFVNIDNLYKNNDFNKIKDLFQSFYKLFTCKYLNIIFFYNTDDNLISSINLFNKIIKSKNSINIINNFSNYNSNNNNNNKNNDNNKNYNNIIYQITNQISSNSITFVKFKKNNIDIDKLKQILEKLKFLKLKFYNKFIEFNFNSRTQAYIEFTNNNKYKINIENINQTITTINKYFYKPKIINLNLTIYIIIIALLTILLLIFYKSKLYNKIVSIFLIFIILFLYSTYLFYKPDSTYILSFELPLNNICEKYINFSTKSINLKYDKNNFYKVLLSPDHNNCSRTNSFFYIKILSQNNLYPIEELQKFYFIKIDKDPTMVKKNKKFYIKFDKTISLIGIK